MKMVRQIKTFKYLKPKELKLAWIDFKNTRFDEEKRERLRGLVVDSIVTGFIIWFALLPFKKFPFIYFPCYGTIAVLVHYYIEWFIEKVKEK